MSFVVDDDVLAAALGERHAEVIARVRAAGASYRAAGGRPGLDEPPVHWIERGGVCLAVWAAEGGWAALGPTLPCGARAVFWPDVEACEAACALAYGHVPADEHEDAILGGWREDELITSDPTGRCP